MGPGDFDTFVFPYCVRPGDWDPFFPYSVRPCDWDPYDFPCFVRPGAWDSYDFDFPYSVRPGAWDPYVFSLLCEARCLGEHGDHAAILFGEL